MVNAVAEFPFVADLPAKDVGKVKSALDLVNELKAATLEHGVLIPVSLAATLLDVKKQTVHHFMSNGRLKRIDCHGHVFVTENSLLDLAKSERKAGRPFKLPQNAKECWDRSKKAFNPEK